MDAINDGYQLQIATGAVKMNLAVGASVHGNLIHSIVSVCWSPDVPVTILQMWGGVHLAAREIGEVYLKSLVMVYVLHEQPSIRRWSCSPDHRMQAGQERV